MEKLENYQHPDFTARRLNQRHGCLTPATPAAWATITQDTFVDKTGAGREPRRSVMFCIVGGAGYW